MRMSGLRRWALVAALALVPAVATCGGDGPVEPPDTPTPGSVTVQLTGLGTVGAMVFEIRGPADDVVALPGLEIRAAQVNGVWRVLAYGSVRARNIVTVTMSDTRQSGQLQFTIVEMADQETFEPVGTDGWVLELAG